LKSYDHYPDKTTFMRGSFFPKKVTDLLFGLVVMMEAGFLADPRCVEGD
jgi:hypothetical protein